MTELLLFPAIFLFFVFLGWLDTRPGGWAHRSSERRRRKFLCDKLGEDYMVKHYGTNWWSGTR